ncbi:MAG: hypothetical protein JNM07_13120 [Phycisphaerae bacterium]|nr:hypothetical protein [Phycisphaerae bacterium]
MHDPGAQGNEFFRCDFCRAAWDESRPMVEGHQGSLICGHCLTIAYARAVLDPAASTPSPEPDPRPCTMCLESRAEPRWRSPLRGDASICRRCIKQSAGVLERDAESGWRRPTANSSAS